MDKIYQQYRIRQQMQEGPDDGWGHFQCLTASFLPRAANGELDLNAWAKIELAKRGLNREGKWLGFNKAFKLFGIDK